MKKVISIVGCGWLGLPLARRLLAEGYAVKGSTTTAEKLPLLNEAGIDAYQLRLNPQPTGNLAALTNADTLIIDIPPKAGKMGDHFHPHQIQYLVESIQTSSLKHIIYVSSTSVYPELSQQAKEEDVKLPEQSAALSLVQAEQLVQALDPDKTVTILRCGGLMGYDRIPGKYVAGRTVDSGAVPVNYLHQDDAVGILTTLIKQPIAGVFNAVAPEHPPREAVYRKSCADFGYELPKFVEPSQVLPYKVISVEKLIEATGYTFAYPNPLKFAYSL